MIGKSIGKKECNLVDFSYCRHTSAKTKFANILYGLVYLPGYNSVAV